MAFVACDVHSERFCYLNILNILSSLKKIRIDLALSLLRIHDKNQNFTAMRVKMV